MTVAFKRGSLSELDFIVECEVAFFRANKGVQTFARPVHRLELPHIIASEMCHSSNAHHVGYMIDEVKAGRLVMQIDRPVPNPTRDPIHRLVERKRAKLFLKRFFVQNAWVS